MGVGYELVNHSKHERVSFAHLGANTSREIAGNPAAAAVVTWYCLKHPQDRVAFVSDTYDDWPFPTGSKSDLIRYRDVTDDIVASLISAGILVDEGRETFWPDEPEVYVRRLRNVWMSAEPSPAPDAPKTRAGEG